MIWLFENFDFFMEKFSPRHCYFSHQCFYGVITVRNLERRVAKLERDPRPEMVFITYIGNREPMSLTLGSRRVDRLTGESWSRFMSRVEDSALT
jgi:hypothetical protein